MGITNLLQIIVLAIIQGLAELLPISSSAHVTVAAKLMGYDTSNAFAWTFLLVMLHTGTMAAVLIYFWSRWKSLFHQIPAMLVATVCTGVFGLALMFVIKHFLNTDPNAPPQEVEHLFLNLPLMACSLAAVGVLIIVAGFRDEKLPHSVEPAQPVRQKAIMHGAFVGAGVQAEAKPSGRAGDVGMIQAAIIGIVQGLALPFRGFSRSGSTISTGMLLGVARTRAEEFSFALAVILTPAIIGREALQLIKEHSKAAADQATQTVAAATDVASSNLGHLFLPGLFGMVFSFAAGLIALKWLSSWLEHGRWKFFGFYCLAAAAGVLAVHFLHG